MFIGKKPCDNFNNALATALMVAFKVTDMNIAADIVEGRSFRLETDYGPLTGALMCGKKYFDHGRKHTVGWVAFRFVDVGACINSPTFPGGGRLNKWSGKWNWTFDGTFDNDYQVDFMVSEIAKLNPRNLITI